MVDRREIVTTAPCTVIDLDGTYIDGNTLKIYLSCGLRYLSTHLKLKELASLLLAVAKRKAGRSSHAEMKRIILSTLYPYPEILTSFAESAKRKINPKVANLIAEKTSLGHKILLATAAPDYYVKKIWNGDYIATRFEDGSAMVECVGQEKLRRVNLWLNDNNCHLDTVVTDHSDDAPLLQANSSGTNILVKPSAETLRFFRELQPAHFLLIEEL